MINFAHMNVYARREYFFRSVIQTSIKQHNVGHIYVAYMKIAVHEKALAGRKKVEVESYLTPNLLCT